MKALAPAVKHYERVVSLEPGHVHEYNKLGFLYYQKGDTQQAEKAFRKAIDADPKVVESYINLAALLMQQGKTDQAITINKKGLEIDPGNEPLHMMKNDLG